MKILLMVVTLMAGCTGFHREAISPSQTAADLESRTLISADFKKYAEQNLHKEITPWPPESWDFKMLTIAALYYHPDMDVARARWGVAEAEVITAGGRPNPGISLLGQHHSATAGGLSPWTFGMSLGIPVETAGKRGLRIEKAGHLSEAARIRIDETAWLVRSRLRKSLLALFSSMKREQFLKDRLAIQQEIVGLAERRLAEGESSEFEAAQYRLDLAKTRLLLSEIQKRGAEDRVSLANALGLQVNALDGIRFSFDLFEKNPEIVSLGDARSHALSYRPDISAALSEYEAAQSALQLEIAKQYPDIHLGPGYEWDQGDNKWSLGLSVELPVFNRNRGPIEEAKARRKESAAKFAALQAGVIGEIDRSQTAYNEALGNLEVADSLISSASNRLQIIRRRFDLGQVDRFELEEARIEFSATELSRLDAFIQTQENLGMLEDAVHQQLSPPEPFQPSQQGTPRPERDK
jgi:cobalt-zinc-cadmium efflux system outer membrane protein